MRLCRAGAKPPASASHDEAKLESSWDERTGAPEEDKAEEAPLPHAPPRPCPWRSAETAESPGCVRKGVVDTSSSHTSTSSECVSCPSASRNSISKKVQSRALAVRLL